MTKFESIGVELQQEAASKEEAQKRFLTSCKICCQRGLQIDCDKCAIEMAHTITIAAIDALRFCCVAKVTHK